MNQSIENIFVSVEKDCNFDTGKSKAPVLHKSNIGFWNFENIDIFDRMKVKYSEVIRHVTSAPI